MVDGIGMRNHNRLYTLLNVLPDADPVVIEAAYKALMKRYHPDIDRDGAAAGERRATELNHAYQTLRNPDRRAAYDAEERAREERRRAELARAFQPPQPGRAPPPPPGRPEPARTGQRFSASIGAAGILALGGAVYLLANAVDPPPPRQVQSARADAAAESAARAGRAFRDQPVSRSEVEGAVGAFRRIAGVSGLAGATAYSRQCFERQTRSGAVPAFDHCVAFDHIAGRAEAIVDQPGGARFQPQSLVSRHIRAAERIARDPSVIEARLFEIRRLADNELGRLAAAATPAPPPKAPAPSPSATEAAPRTRPPPARVRVDRPALPDQDFLERQGGIY